MGNKQALVKDGSSKGQIGKIRRETKKKQLPKVLGQICRRTGLDKCLAASL